MQLKFEGAKVRFFSFVSVLWKRNTTLLSRLVSEFFCQRIEQLGETFGNGHWTVVFDEAVRAVSDADHFALNTHCVFKLKLHCTHFAYFNVYFDDILECGRTFVFT